MSVVTLNYSKLFRVFFTVLACAVVLNACATRPPPGYYSGGYQGVSGATSSSVADYQNTSIAQPFTRDGVAVFGVAAIPYKLRNFRQNNLAAMLESQIRALQPVNGVVPYNLVKKTLHEKREHQVLLKRFEHNGILSQSDLQFLKHASLPARYIVLARIERDDTTRYQPIKSALKNHNGDTLSDKQQITLLHQRTVQVSARAYDLDNGREAWSGTFISQPVNRSSYTEYLGSSFAGAMATRFTNSFVNGRTGKKYPSAPRASETIREAFKSIAKALNGHNYAGL